MGLDLAFVTWKERSFGHWSSCPRAPADADPPYFPENHQTQSEKISSSNPILIRPRWLSSPATSTKRSAIFFRRHLPPGQNANDLIGTALGQVGDDSSQYTRWTDFPETTTLWCVSLLRRNPKTSWSRYTTWRGPPRLYIDFLLLRIS